MEEKSLEIILSGYGKMGKTIHKVALEKGHHVLFTIDNQEEWEKLPASLPHNTVVIDFSMPKVAVSNMMRCFDRSIPIVVGTTGWYDRLEAVERQCKEKDGTLLYAPNFSMGVQMLFYLNRELARMMGNMEGYKAEIKETHHLHKLDAPSGTAIHLATDILKNNQGYKQWINKRSRTENTLGIVSERQGEVAGIHEVVYDSSIDRITLKHEAKSREGFARGAVLAAEFLVDKKGVFTIHDLIKTIGI